MRFVILFFLFLIQGCATKYIIPGNRFMTPETQGGVLLSHFEFQQASANQLFSDVSKGTTDRGVTQQVVSRAGFLFGTSLYESIDFFWSHTGGGNSLFGGKLQVLGTSKAAKGAGHKLALAAALGGNEHETEGANSVEFELGGQEYNLLYGYRFSENILAYSNLSYANYSFNGVVNSYLPSINGLRPSYKTKAIGLFAGAQFDFGMFYAKVESGYQQLTTTDTSDVSNFHFGYSLGLSW
jgi:hypothetical protein